MDTDRGFNIFRARAIREAAGVPVIAVGRISPEMADEAIARGDTDLVAFGRQHLCDPEFIAKLKQGRREDIRWCTACNQGCIERLAIEMKSAACTFNPTCGREYREDPGLGPSEGRKRLWVIGAGPAGLSAALSASARGCAVEVFEKEAEPGGQLLPASVPPRKEVFLDWLRWAVRQLNKRGVPLRLGNEVTAGALERERPDAVIIATGAVPWAADIPGIRSSSVFDARDVLMGRVEPVSPAVVLGAGYVGMETADFLIARGIETVILEMKHYEPVGKFTAHGYWLNRRIRDGGGRLVLGVVVKAVEPGAVVFEHGGREMREPAAMVITAMGARPADELAGSASALGIPMRVVGDAGGPRRLLEAIHEGHRAGLEI